MLTGDGNAGNLGLAEDSKSIKSKRSLSINVNKVSKITKVNGDIKNALSKEKDPLAALRHRSVDRAASRGRAANGSANVRPKLGNLYTLNNEDHRSQEDLKSHVSRTSNVVKDMVQANYASLTPAKQSVPNMLSENAKLGGSLSANRNAATKHALTLDAAMEADGKSVNGESRCDSYKKRSKSNFRNPLLPPKENLVSIPDFEKGGAFRTPYY